MNKNIYMIYGSNLSFMTKRLLESIDVYSQIGAKEKRIVIKPNLVIAGRPDEGATTHTEIVTATIEYLKDGGFNDITIAESSWVGARTEDAFHLLGYYDIAKEYDVSLIDTKRDRFRRIENHGIAMEIAETALDAGFIINIPVLKGHCQTLMTHAMKNLKGLLSDKSKRDFHRYGLMKPIAALSDIIRSDLIISDGICGDLDFEEGGNPVHMDRMMAASDQFLIDAYAATLMGFSPYNIGYIKVASEWGIFSPDLSGVNIVELNRPQSSSGKPTGMAQRLAGYTAPDNACSACFASLIHALKRLDDEGLLSSLGKEKIAVGQGYKGKCPAIGSGSCCSSASVFVKGCPPKADDILAMLKKLL